MRNLVIGILFASLIAIAIVAFFDEHPAEINELKCKEIILIQQLDSLKTERIFVDAQIDSLKIASSRIKEKIKVIPVYIPGRFDTLSNKQLQAAMLEEYRNFNQ